MIISVVARFPFTYCFLVLCFHSLCISYVSVLHKCTLFYRVLLVWFLCCLFCIQVFIPLFSPLSSFTSVCCYGMLKYTVRVKLPGILRSVSECKGEWIDSKSGFRFFLFFIFSFCSNKVIIQLCFQHLIITRSEYCSISLFFVLIIARSVNFFLLSYTMMAMAYIPS